MNRRIARPSNRPPIIELVGSKHSGSEIDMALHIAATINRGTFVLFPPRRAAR